MDSYLVLLTERKNQEPIAARLVDYRAGFERGITDEFIISGRRLRLWVTPATYCAMDAKAFAVRHAFDPSEIATLQGELPCVVVRR